MNRSAIVVGALVAGWVTSLATSVSFQQGAGKGQKGLIERVETLERDLQRQRAISPPVGSVTAFAGEWPPRKSDKTRWPEAEIGWLLCDGRKITLGQHEDLRAVLGKDTLPDYRGYFMRGIDVSIDGKTSGRDKEGIRPVGKPQEYATALPQHNKLVADEGGEHDNPGLWKAPGDDGRLNRWFDQRKTSKDIQRANGIKHDLPSLISFEPLGRTGKHTHSISGGDKETRPVNVAVYYIIKFK